MSLIHVAETFALPLIGDLQAVGVAHSGTITLPATPFLPRWMWAAWAAPLRCEYVSVHFKVVPVSVAVNVPVAPDGTPAGFGTS